MTAPWTSLQQLVVDDVASWPAKTAACVVLSSRGTLAVAGDLALPLPWASVTKIVAALAVLEVVFEGSLRLDDPAGPKGSTLRHLLGHTSGLACNEHRVVAAPGRRRCYSNVGIDLAVDLAVRRSGSQDAGTLLRERVLNPLGMTSTVLVGPASHGALGPVSDLALLARELLVPTVLTDGIVAAATAPSFPGLPGLLPGFGRQDPNDWGLGVELRGTKSPHWLPRTASPSSAGHFGQAGALVWADRPHDLAVACATGTQFGPWAAEAWPRDLGRWLGGWLQDRPASSPRQ